MEKEFVLRIANEINRQIRCGVTMSVQMSWGISKRIATLYNDRVTLALKSVAYYIKDGCISV